MKFIDKRTDFQKDFTKVETVYEDKFFVRSEDLLNRRRTMIYIYNAKGDPICRKERGSDGKFYSQGQLLDKGNIRNIF